MRGIKGFVVIATIIATAAALGACRSEEPDHLKFSSDTSVSQPAR